MFADQDKELRRINHLLSQQEIRGGSDLTVGKVLLDMRGLLLGVELIEVRRHARCYAF